MSLSEEKRKKFEELMKEDHVLLHLDARKEGVHVPMQLSDNPSLTLKLSYLFQGETTHDENAITSFLKFSGQYHECVVPWDAVWGITSSAQHQSVWPEDLPKEVMVDLARQQFAALGKKLFGRKGKDSAEEEQQLEEMQADTPPHN
jgi:stringent starvation protein B